MLFNHEPPDAVVDLYVDALAHGDEKASAEVIEEALSQGGCARLGHDRTVTTAQEYAPAHITLSHTEMLRSRLRPHSNRGQRVAVYIRSKGIDILSGL